MALKMAALKTLLTNDAAYDAEVKGGSYKSILKRLRVADPALPHRWSNISWADAEQAVLGLTTDAAQNAVIDRWAQSQEVHLENKPVRDWITAQFGAPALATFRAVCPEGRPMDAFINPGDADAGREDLLAILRSIPKSGLHPTTMANIATVKADRAVLVAAEKKVLLDIVTADPENEIRGWIKKRWWYSPRRQETMEVRARRAELVGKVLKDGN